MRHWRIWLYLVSMVAILGSCYMVEMQNRLALSGASNPFEAVFRTELPTETVAPVAQVTSLSTGDPPAIPTDAPTETAVAVVDPVDQCLECHIDKAQLIDSAAPEEVVVAESEGAG